MKTNIKWVPVTGIQGRYNDNGKKKLRGNHFTAISKKSMIKIQAVYPRISCSKIDNSLLFNETNNSGEYDEESKECYLFVNGANILNFDWLNWQVPSM